MQPQSSSGGAGLAGAARRSSAFLRGLRIEGFRAFERFECGSFRQHNFIVGPTASGKTTVLHAVRLLEAHARGAPLLTGDMDVGPRGGRSGRAVGLSVFRNWNLGCPVSVAGDYDGGFCTHFSAWPVDPAAADVRFSWCGVGLLPCHRLLSVGSTPRSPRGRVREIAAPSVFARGRVADGLAHPGDRWSVDGVLLDPLVLEAELSSSIVVVHDMNCCVDVYGPSFWPLLLRLIAGSGSQLFAGLALRSLLDGLALPPGDSVAFVSLSGAS